MMVDPLKILEISGLASLLPKGIGQKVLSFLGFGKKVLAESGTTKAEEGGVGVTDEHHYLIGLASAHFGGSVTELMKMERLPALDKPRREKIVQIFERLRAEGKPAGAEKLMHIIGHESHLITTGKPRNMRRRKGAERSDKSVQEDDLFEYGWKDRVNPSGQLILLFLSDIDIEEAVRILTASAVIETNKDKAAATAKASKEAIGKAWEDLKAWYREHDTEVHIMLARACVDKENVIAILESDAGKAHRQAIEAVEGRIKTEKDKVRLAELREELHQKHEDLQRFLLGEVKRIQALQVGQQEPQGEPPAPASRWNWKLIEKACYGVIGGGIVIVFLVRLIVYLFR